MKILKVLSTLLLVLSIEACKKGDGPTGKKKIGGGGGSFNLVEIRDSSSVTTETSGGLTVLLAFVAFNRNIDSYKYSICANNLCSPTQDSPQEIHPDNAGDTSVTQRLITNNACNASSPGTEITCSVFLKPCNASGCSSEWVQETTSFTPLEVTDDSARTSAIIDGLNENKDKQIKNAEDLKKAANKHQENGGGALNDAANEIAGSKTGEVKGALNGGASASSESEDSTGLIVGLSVGGASLLGILGALYAYKYKKSAGGGGNTPSSNKAVNSSGTLDKSRSAIGETIQRADLMSSIRRAQGKVKSAERGRAKGNVNSAERGRAKSQTNARVALFQDIVKRGASRVVLEDSWGEGGRGLSEPNFLEALRTNKAEQIAQQRADAGKTIREKKAALKTVMTERIPLKTGPNLVVLKAYNDANTALEKKEGWTQERISSAKDKANMLQAELTENIRIMQKIPDPVYRILQIEADIASLKEVQAQPQQSSTGGAEIVKTINSLEDQKELILNRNSNLEKTFSEEAKAYQKGKLEQARKSLKKLRETIPDELDNYRRASSDEAVLSRRMEMIRFTKGKEYIDKINRESGSKNVKTEESEYFRSTLRKERLISKINADTAPKDFKEADDKVKRLEKELMSATDPAQRQKFAEDAFVARAQRDNLLLQQDIRGSAEMIAVREVYESAGIKTQVSEGSILRRLSSDFRFQVEQSNAVKPIVQEIDVSKIERRTGGVSPVLAKFEAEEDTNQRQRERRKSRIEIEQNQAIMETAVRVQRVQVDADLKIQTFKAQLVIYADAHYDVEHFDKRYPTIAADSLDYQKFRDFVKGHREKALKDLQKSFKELSSEQRKLVGLKEGDLTTKTKTVLKRAFQALATRSKPKSILTDVTFIKQSKKGRNIIKVMEGETRMSDLAYRLRSKRAINKLEVDQRYSNTKSHYKYASDVNANRGNLEASTTTRGTARQALITSIFRGFLGLSEGDDKKIEELNENDKEFLNAISKATAIQANLKKNEAFLNVESFRIKNAVRLLVEEASRTSSE